ncbi:MAG: hypothetical protein QY325_15295 [Flavobacteriales bacterium]|nr:MAG: hypothetical protein QY325_15295 [Flavobacteriales bacterium]
MRRLPHTAALVLCSIALSAQPTVVQHGKPFARSMKGATGDLLTVVDGAFAADGRHLLYVEEGITPKAIRLDALLQPAEELTLKDVLLDGLKWTAVTPVMDGARMRVLLVSATKKGSEFGIAEVSAGSALSLTGFRRLAACDIPYANDPANTMAARPLPDPILFTRGLAYAQRERLIPAPDGQHYLLNHFTHSTKGGKRIALAWLDRELTVLWQAAAELPYEDAKSSIHQIAVEDDGTVRLLTYVYQCKSEEQLGDKNCHELHLTTLTEDGKAVSDILLEKDFVASARLLPRSDGRLALALRYGALTGQPGLAITFDPADPKLKPAPITAQRLPSIRKARLMAFGDPTADPRKPPARTAKVADEVVDLLPGPDGGLLVVETFLQHDFMLPMGDAVAMRRLGGAVRVSQVQPNDSIGWQRTIDRALMTTAGQAYDGCVAVPMEGRLLLLHGHTPKGYEAILRAGGEAAGQKDLRPAEPQVLKAAFLDARTGAVEREGTALMMEDGFVPCPQGTLLEWGGSRALVKSYDRGTQYRFTVIDLARLGEER